MLRSSFLAKIAGAFALGHLLPSRPSATYQYEHFGDEEPRFIVRVSDPPSAVEAQYWIDRGMTHCMVGRETRPLTHYATQIETLEVRL